MASQSEFNITLVRIGLNDLNAEALIISGFDEISILSEVKEKDVIELACHIERWQGPRIATHDADGMIINPDLQQITLPFLSINKFKNTS